ncbi:unnamed protein product [Phytophthora fragariaefolia]|uniref:Unnamed protein product n=1 Tax=Phytophthora fragariaefolia TaxID=1490495 RepID=A0A9W6U848_9STRA|nr:unnamed protein product [Phytophthora fragariaefolia]
MQLRRELGDSWAPTQTFTFDGSTSDLALQLYSRFKAGDTLAKLSLSTIPDTVTSRLSDGGVAFDDLDGFAQRAVLWDSGFALTPTNDVKQIWTLEGRSMAEIALTLDEFEATTCTAYDCTQPDGTVAHNNHLCTGTKMLTAAKCVVEEYAETNLNLAAWSIGGDSTTIPEIGLSKHTWTDAGVSYKVYAVHTLNTNSERSYGDCPSTDTYGCLNFPCYGSDDIPSSQRTVPTPSDWVTSWMKTYSTSSGSVSSGGSSSSALAPSTSASTNSRTTDASASIATDDGKGTNVALLGGIAGGVLGVLLIAILVALLVLNRRKKQNSSNDQGSPMVCQHIEMASPDGAHWNNRLPKVSSEPEATDGPFQRSGVTVRSSEDARSNPGTERGVKPLPQHGRGNQAPPPYFDDNFRNNQGREASSHNQQNYRPPVDGPWVKATQASSRLMGGRSLESDAALVSATTAAVVLPPIKEPRRTGARASQQSVKAPHHIEQIRGTGSHNALEVLAADPTVNRRRIQLSQLQVDGQLPMTTLQTDSCIGHLNGQQVLIKRLAPSSSINVPAVESLAFEIQQRGHTGHKNICQFIGAGWTSAHDLALVVEFHPQGTLRAFLDRNKEGMSAWTPQKTNIAGGIARALAYLHEQTPAFIHHELCAKNVLLTDELEAKLANCGSTEKNAAVGLQQKSRLAYWMAPEALEGGPYSTATDIYSFGVLLAELDTCRIPYFNALSPDGSSMEQDEIIKLVMEGRLRPTFSAECPNFIRQLAEACFEQDPAKRLTAQQIVQLLEGR